MWIFVDVDKRGALQGREETEWRMQKQMEGRRADSSLQCRAVQDRRYGGINSERARRDIQKEVFGLVWFGLVKFGQQNQNSEHEVTPP